MVINRGNGVSDPTQDAIDGSGYVFMTQSYATTVLDVTKAGDTSRFVLFAATGG